MPFGGLLSLAGPALSIGSSLFGMANGTPAQQVQQPQTYNYGNLGGADQGAYSGIGGLSNYNIGASFLPQFQQIAQSGINNPYAGGYQTGAGQAGQLGQQGAMNSFNAGGNLTGSALSNLPDVSALLSLGFDPQQALYAKMQNQNQQQNAAILGQSGVAQTPYGAGVAADANTNFNLGWEQQALARASQGAQGAGSLLGSIGNAATTGQNLQATAPGQFLQSSGMPYNTFQGINANALGTLSQAGQFGQQAAAIPQMSIQDYMAYLSGGTSQQGANTQASQFGLNQANSTFNQQQTMGNQLGQGLSGLSNAWGKTGWGGTGTGGGGGFATNSWAQANPGAAGSAFYGPAAA